MTPSFKLAFLVATLLLAFGSILASLFLSDKHTSKVGTGMVVLTLLGLIVLAIAN